MNESLLLIGSVILICILLDKYIKKIPVPSLLIFILIGMLFGENGIFRIVYNDYEAVNLTCSVSLIFIMFYGGFSTNIKTARPIIIPSVLLSTIGVTMTAGLVCLFCNIALKLPLTESFLIGSVIASTDAASVFNILRNKKLSLKYRTDSMLEMESGSNDPVSYMLTIIAIALLGNEKIAVIPLLFSQLIIGIICGLFIGQAAVKIMQRPLLPSQESHTVFIFSIIILAYALPSVLGGNGYLSIYLCGITIGNANLSQKKYLVHFFDSLTHIAQVLIFFLLGLLVTPVNLSSVFLPSIAVMTFITFVARPLAVLAVLLPFRPQINQIILVSWSGLRGAASIVFAIMATLSFADQTYDLYNLVFCIVLLSVAIQGSTLPYIAKKLNMIDNDFDIKRTFTDYQEESDINFIKLRVNKFHPWLNKNLRQIKMPPDLLVAMIIRNNTVIIPDGNTKILINDMIVVAAREFEERDHFVLSETIVDKNHNWSKRSLADIDKDKSERIILIKRGSQTIIPSGRTVLEPDDILVMVNI